MYRFGVKLLASGRIYRDEIEVDFLVHFFFFCRKNTKKYIVSLFNNIMTMAIIGMLYQPKNI